MPADDGLRLDQFEGLPPLRPEALQGDPEEPAAGRHPPPRLAVLKDRELLAQREVLEDQVGPRAQEGSESRQERAKHAGSCLPGRLVASCRDERCAS